MLDSVALLDEMIVTGDGDAGIVASKLRHIPRAPGKNSAISSAVEGSQLGVSRRDRW